MKNRAPRVIACVTLLVPLERGRDAALDLLPDGAQHPATALQVRNADIGAQKTDHLLHGRRCCLGVELLDRDAENGRDFL